MSFVFSDHAIQRLNESNLTEEDIEKGISIPREFVDAICARPQRYATDSEYFWCEAPVQQDVAGIAVISKQKTVITILRVKDFRLEKAREILFGKGKAPKKTRVQKQEERKEINDQKKEEKKKKFEEQVIKSGLEYANLAKIMSYEQVGTNCKQFTWNLDSIYSLDAYSLIKAVKKSENLSRKDIYIKFYFAKQEQTDDLWVNKIENTNIYLRYLSGAWFAELKE